LLRLLVKLLPPYCFSPGFHLFSVFSVKRIFTCKLHGAVPVAVHLDRSQKHLTEGPE